MLETVYLLLPVLILPVCLLAALVIMTMEAWGAMKRKAKNGSGRRLGNLRHVPQLPPDSANVQGIATADVPMN